MQVTLRGDAEAIVRTAAARLGLPASAVATMLVTMGAKAFWEARGEPEVPVDPVTQALPRGPDTELVWRVERCWDTYTRMWAWFWRREGDGDRQAPPLDVKTKAAIMAAIRSYDANLLTEAMRSEWEAKSVARAAAGGIFLDPWHAGKRGNDRYLEPWRCWGKHCRRFAGHLWAHRDSHEQGRQQQHQTPGAGLLEPEVQR